MLTSSIFEWQLIAFKLHKYLIVCMNFLFDAIHGHFWCNFLVYKSQCVHLHHDEPKRGDPHDRTLPYIGLWLLSSEVEPDKTHIYISRCHTWQSTGHVRSASWVNWNDVVNFGILPLMFCGIQYQYFDMQSSEPLRNTSHENRQARLSL